MQPYNPAVSMQAYNPATEPTLPFNPSVSTPAYNPAAEPTPQFNPSVSTPAYNPATEPMQLETDNGQNATLCEEAHQPPTILLTDDQLAQVNPSIYPAGTKFRRVEYLPLNLLSC